MSAHNNVTIFDSKFCIPNPLPSSQLFDHLVYDTREEGFDKNAIFPAQDSEFIKLFGVTYKGHDDYRKIFNATGLRDLFRDMVYHESWRTTTNPAQWREKSPNWENGLVGTAVVNTVRNIRRGIRGGDRVVLTIAVFGPRSNWEKAVNNKLDTTTARKLCSGKENAGGAFEMAILDPASPECVRLLSNMISWTVLQNADQFSYEYDPGTIKVAA